MNDLSSKAIQSYCNGTLTQQMEIDLEELYEQLWKLDAQQKAKNQNIYFESNWLRLLTIDTVWQFLKSIVMENHIVWNKVII